MRNKTVDSHGALRAYSLTFTVLRFRRTTVFELAVYIPLKTTHSRIIAEALVNVFSRVGLPDEIVSDQGANLIGSLMTQLYELLGIQGV